ncbi:MAG: transcriptional repressor [Desulfobacteraceae bacterium]|nr:transcriptional repressor [Desulfobacteraceae bacterium]
MKNNTNQLRLAFNTLGKRYTAQRQKILDVFNKNTTGLTIAQAVEMLRSEGIGHTTVYRTVKELTEMGFLQWAHTPQGEHLFISSKGGHCHPLVCRLCGIIELVDCQGMSTLQKLIAVETGFQIEGHHLEFKGICKQCQEAEI